MPEAPAGRWEGGRRHRRNERGAMPDAARGRSRRGWRCVVRREGSFISRVRWREGATDIGLIVGSAGPTIVILVPKFGPRLLFSFFQKFYQIHLIS